MDISALQFNNLSAEEASTKDDCFNVYNLSSTFGGMWNYYFSPEDVNPLYYFEHRQREVLQLPVRLTNPLFGRVLLNSYLRENAKNVLMKDEIYKITENLPSLSQLLSDERNKDE